MKEYRTVKLTSLQAFNIVATVNAWNTRNKALPDDKKVLSIPFFKKLFEITSALEETTTPIDMAIAAAGVSGNGVQIAINKLFSDLALDKESKEYSLPFLTEEEFDRMVDGHDTYKALNPILEK